LNLEPISQIIISKNYQDVISNLKSIAPQDSRFELFIKEDSNFLVSDANEVIAKAHLASKEKVFICLGANTFSDIVQNRLLKVIEEPPKNKIFILITPLKSALLPTIKSRLPITIIKEEVQNIELNLDIKNLNLQSVYNFLQENRRLKPQEAIILMETITQEAIKSQSYNLDKSLLDTFSKVRISLDIGCPTDFALTTLLLKLLAKKIKR